MDIKEYRESKNLKAAELVKVVKSMYPKYDKHLHSKIERPLSYGVRLAEPAEALITTTFGAQGVQAPKQPIKADRRKLPMRAQCRLSERDYDGLQQALRCDGYDTMQAGLSRLIRLYILCIKIREAKNIQTKGDQTNVKN